MNLIAKPEGKRVSRPVQLSLLGFLLVGLALPHSQKNDALSIRPLGIEEQEIVASAFEGIEGRIPEAARSAQRLSRELRENVLPSGVDPQLPSEDLVRRNDNALVFSDRFFDADNIAQENSLLRVLGALNPKPSRTGEIAIIQK